MKKLLLLTLILSLGSTFPIYGFEKMELIDKESFEILTLEKDKPVVGKKPFIKKRTSAKKRISAKREKVFVKPKKFEENLQRKTLSSALDKVSQAKKEKEEVQKEQGVSLKASSLDPNKFLKEEIAKSKNDNLFASTNIDAKRPSAEKEELNYRYDFWRFGSKVFFTLCLILAVIYLIYRFLAHRQGLSLTEDRSLVKVLSTSPLAPGRHMQLVEVGDRILILGMSEKSITPLGEIKDRDTIDSIKVRQSKSLMWKGLPFAKHLKGFLKEHRLDSKMLGPTESQKEKILFLEKERERLKSLDLSYKVSSG